MITINLTKAKAIAHELRRAAREEEMRPYDEVLAKRLPGAAREEADAEAARASLREKYDRIQDRIEAATTVAELKTEIEAFKTTSQP